MAAILFTLLFVLLPVIAFPAGPYSIEVSKVLLFEGLVWVYFIAAFLRSPSPSIPKLRPWHGAVFLLGMLALFHALLQQSPVLWWGNPMRLQGVFFFCTLLASSLLFAEGTVLRLMPLIVLVILFISTFVIRSTETTRAVGLLGEPNALAAAVLGLWPWCLGIVKKKGYRWDWMTSVSAALAGYIVVVSGSRSGIAAFLVELLWVYVFLFRKKWTVSATVLTVFAYFGLHGAVFADRISDIESRRVIWQTAVQAIVRHPVFGTGVGSVEYALRTAGLSLSNALRFVPVDSAHNIFLDLGVQLGLVGLAAFGYLLVRAAVAFYRHAAVVPFVQLVGIVFAASFNPMGVVTLGLLWHLIGAGQRARDRGKRTL